MKGRRLLALAVASLAATPGCATRPASPPPAPATRSGPDYSINDRSVNDVVVEQALFGSGTRLVDVTARVVQLLRSEPAGFAPAADWLHADPAPGKNKSLLIRYRFRGKERLFIVTGGNRASYAALVAVADEDADHAQ
ncbi:MAG TPA: hypothetical protein VH475_02605 [Tepidisphaeraceae bacterium]|jgi:hypothetical protein